MPEVPIVATVVAPEVHIPPLLLLLNVADDPMHILDEPVIMDGNPLTVIVFVTKQPVGNVYVMFAVLAAMPVMIPVDPTVAVVMLLLLHVPPDVTSVKAVVNPTHAVGVPVILDGVELIVTIVFT